MKTEKQEKCTLHDTVSFLDRSGRIPTDQYDKYMQFVVDLADTNRQETAAYDSSKHWLDRVLLLRKKHKLHPRKAQIKKLYEQCLKDGTILETNPSLEQFLQGRQSRSLSGILVIAVLMSPYPVYYDKKSGKVKTQRFSCAHNCYYCPNEAGMPRSYLSKEPAVARALRVNFNAIDQFYARAHTLQKLGHDIDKIELLVLGGTFCQFPQQYQEEFIRDLFWSANTFYDGISDFSSKRPRKPLAEEIKIHETATKCRIVGLTLETRPDTITDFESIRRFREYGATRIQLGVQHVDDDVLKEINRGCCTSDTVRAVRLLKNSGYKIDIHLMPNLPGSTPEKDDAMFATLLAGDLIQCDQWKVYPCQTVDFSLIQKWYKEGIYVPYSLDKLMNVLINMKSTIHPWIRLNRIFRSLPTRNVTAGITMSNFRQYMYKSMCDRGLNCKCIRCREIGTHIRRNKATELRNKLQSQRIVLKQRMYDSSGGKEVFLSFESEDETVLLGFVRLRLPPIYIKPADRKSLGLNPTQAFLGEFKADSDNYGTQEEYANLVNTFPELYRAALVREAHVYGAKQQIKDSKGGRCAVEKNDVREIQNLTGQSKGYGKTLMAAAERIARDHGYSRVAVIAGVGTRLYYRMKLGYKSSASYMVKDFTESVAGTAVKSKSLGIVHQLQAGHLTSAVAAASIVCLALFLLFTFVSIILSLLLTTAAILWFDYLHFYAIDYTKIEESASRSLLNLSRIGLLLINLAVLFKWFSAFLPHIAGFQIPLILSQLIGGADNNDGGSNGDCFCRTYWSLSLVSYVTAFYILKLIYHKRMIIIIQNPIFGNDTGAKSIPLSVVGLLLGQVFAFSLVQFLVLNYVGSHCTDEPLSEYDVSSPYGCHDSFAAVDTWFAICAILFDGALFSLFCSKWYSLMFILMEEIAISLLIQFVLVIIGMISDVIDAVLHMILLYYHKEDPHNFDSFLGTPAFCLDCCIIAACLVLSFTSSQKYVLNMFGVNDLTTYYQSIQKIGYALPIM